MKDRPQKRRHLAIVMAVILGLTTAACGSSEPEATTTTGATSVTTTQPGGSPSTTQPGGSPDTTEGQAVEPQTVVIGQIGHLTGVGADPFGIPVDNGMKMAVEQINASGFLSDVGVTLELSTDDDGTDPTRAVTILNTLIQDDIQIAISSSFTTVAATLFPIANDEEVLLISVGSGGTGEDLEDYFFRMNDTVGPMIAMGSYLVDVGGAESIVAIIDGDNPAFPVVADAVESGTRNAGAPGFASRETISGSDTDFSSILTNLLTTEPDAIHIAATPPVVGAIISQLDQLPNTSDIRRTGAAGGGEQIYAVAGSASTGTLLGQAWAPPETRGNDLASIFANDYETRYNLPASPYSALGSDTAWLLAVAIKMVVLDGVEVTGTTLKDVLPAAAASAEYRERALVQGLELPASGAPSYPGVVATIDADGNVISTGQ